MYKKLLLLAGIAAIMQTATAQSSGGGNKTTRDTIVTGYKMIDGKLYTPVDNLSPVTVQGWSSTTKTFDKDKLTTKEIAMELTADKENILILDNEGKNIEIKTWNQSKIKVVTNVLIDGKSELEDKEWYDKLSITLSKTGISLRLKMRGNSGNFYSYGYTTVGNATVFSANTNASVSVFNGSGNVVGNMAGTNRVFTVYVPQSLKMEIDNRYGNLSIAGKITELDLTAGSGTIDIDDADKLKLRSAGANFSAENINDAEIELTGGRFRATDIKHLDIDTKTSTVEINSVDDMIIRSTNDQYDIEEAGDIHGRKNYGNLRITTLKKLLDVEGANADIRIRNIDPAVELIKIDNKYADIRLPMKQIKNFAVDFRGAYNTVYAPFEKIPMLVEEKGKTAEKDNGDKSTTTTLSGRANAGSYVALADGMIIATENGAAPTRFTATGGDTKGKHTKFTITCSSCTVDFK